jgi:hypothetical protein
MDLAGFSDNFSSMMAHSQAELLLLLVWLSYIGHPATA